MAAYYLALSIPKRQTFTNLHVCRVCVFFFLFLKPGSQELASRPSTPKPDHLSGHIWTFRTLLALRRTRALSLAQPRAQPLSEGLEVFPRHRRRQLRAPHPRVEGMHPSRTGDRQETEIQEGPTQAS